MLKEKTFEKLYIMSGLSDSKQTSSPSLSDTSLCLDDSKTTNFSDVKMLQNKLLETKAASTSMKFHLLDEVDGNTNKNDSKIIQKQISSGKKWAEQLILDFIMLAFSMY